MAFIGIGFGMKPLRPDVFVVNYRHKDYGSGSMQLHGPTLQIFDKPVPAGPGLPRELSKIESDFPGMQIKRVEEEKSVGSDKVRYLLQWETLGANRDHARKPPLPAPSPLRLYKLVEVRRKDHPRR